MKGISAIILIGAVVLSIQRVAVWQDDYVLWRDSLERNPSDRRALGWVAQTCVENGRWEEGLRVLQRAISLYPDDYYLNYLQGKAYAGKEDIEGAQAAFTRALGLFPGYEASLTEEKVRSDNMWPFVKGMVDNAGPSEIFSTLGLLYESKGMLREAEASFRKAEAGGPDYARGANNLGNFLSRRGRYPEAVAEYRKSIVFDPVRASTYSNLGAALFSMGKIREARFALEKALALNPEMVDANVNMGVLLLSRGLDQEARAYLARARRLGARIPTLDVPVRP